MMQPLEYADPDLHPSGGVQLVFAFGLAMLIGGTVSNVAYDWLLGQRPRDDSLEILFTVLGILLGIAVVMTAAATAFLVRRGRRATAGAARMAALIGFIYGTLPAVGFFYSERISLLDRFEPLLPLLVFGLPVLLPFWLLKFPSPQQTT